MFCKDDVNFLTLSPFFSHLPLPCLQGEDTALELAICPPTLGEETNLGINSTLDTTATVPRDFVQENMKVSGRISSKTVDCKC